MVGTNNLNKLKIVRIKLQLIIEEKFHVKNLFLLVIFLLKFGVLYSQSPDIQTKIKAVYIKKFSEFSVFPNKAQLSEIKIGVLSQNKNIYMELHYVINGRLEKGRPIKLIDIDSINEISKFQILYIGKSYSSKIQRINEQIGDFPTLTIGDSLDDLSSMINFIVDNGKLKFNLNLNNARAKNILFQEILFTAAHKIFGKKETSSVGSNETEEKIDNKSMIKKSKKSKNITEKELESNPMIYYLLITSILIIGFISFRKFRKKR